MNALHLVTDQHGMSHIAVSSPAIMGATPNSQIVLCGATATTAISTPIAEVECADCLFTSQMYWGLPAWSHEAATA